MKHLRNLLIIPMYRIHFIKLRNLSIVREMYIHVKKNVLLHLQNHANISTLEVFLILINGLPFMKYK